MVNLQKDKKGIELSLQVIVIFIILLIVLIVVIAMFTTQFGENTTVLNNVSSTAIDSAREKLN